MAEPIEQYLTTYAEPEAKTIAQGLGGYDVGLSVPVRDETAAFLDGYEAAAATAAAAGERVLIVVVLNAAASALSTSGDQALLRRFREERGGLLLPGGHVLLARPWADVLVVDHVSEGRRFAPKQGAGLARKVGSDILLHLWASNRLRRPWLFSTDADVVLPADYFVGALARAPAEASALLLPFIHVAGGDERVLGATDAYELWLRYYRAGLHWAGSPYAFIALGSAMAVHAQAYAAVRGYSKRLAGEDYYTLDKLAKLRPLAALDIDPVQITARTSARVPFGTGPQVQRLLDSDGPQSQLFLSPKSFYLLRAALQGMTRFCAHREVGRLQGELEASERGEALVKALTELGTFAALGRMRTQVGGERALLSRVHGWFDGLKTLQLLHRLRDGGLGACAWREAVETAPFSPLGQSPTGGECLRAALQAFRSQSIASRIGVAVTCESALADRPAAL